MDTNFQPIIFKNTRGHYPQHPLEFKRALVALSLQPGASVARIAREHGVNANQVFSWRRLYEQGRLGVPALRHDDGLLPVVLAPTVPAPSGDTSHANGIIVLELGEARNALTRAVLVQRLGEISDRTFEQQRYRASGLPSDIGLTYRSHSGLPNSLPTGAISSQARSSLLNL